MGTVNIQIRILVFFSLLILFPLNLISQEDQPVDKKLYVVPIHGDIEKSLVVFINRGIKEAEKAGAEIIVFDINTFGGRVDSALQIAAGIGAVTDAETVAFIPASPEGTGVSWSAGALISFACESIYMSPGTSIGAAAPVYQTQEGMQMADEKVVSAVRGQMAALAEKNGYPKGIALAMVDKDVELFEVNIGSELIAALSENIPELEKKAQAEGKSFEKGKIISSKGKLLTLTAGEMEKYGVSSGTIATLDELLEIFSIESEETVTIEETLPDRLIALVTSSAVVSLLLMIGMICLYIEITSPGFGIPGTVALICLAIVFAGNGLLGNVASLELLMFLFGIVLLIVEIFIIPGFGVAGVSGIILIAVSLVLSQQNFVWPEFEWQWDIFKTNILVIGLSLLGSIFIISILLFLFPRITLFNRLILKSVQKADSGFTVQKEEDKVNLIGRQGKLITPLRPVGKAEFDGEIMIVETEGEYLLKGAFVTIIEVSGNRVVVQRSSV